LREGTRDANVIVHVERLWQDLRHGVRVSARNPGLAAIAVLSIAVGTGANVAVFSMADALLLRPLDSSMIVVLTILSAAVLAVACANVAGLLASRAPVRAREMAMRLAIGANRARLVRQLVTESLVVALAGGLGGLAVAHVGIMLLGQISFPSDTLVTPSFAPNGRALLLSLTVAMLAAFLVGVGPAWQMTRVDLAAAIKSTERGNAARQRLTGRSVLVALQVALALVVLTIAVFSVQVFSSELDKGPGFRTTRMAKVTVNPGQARYDRAGSDGVLHPCPR
jgi:putative ABC transport system permease protein